MQMTTLVSADQTDPPMDVRPAKRETVVLATYSFDTGGSEILALRLSDYYKASGFNVICCGTRKGPGELCGRYAERGIPYLALELDRLNRILKMLVKCHLWLWLRRHKVTALHAQHFSVFSDVRRTAILAGVKTFLVTEHTDYPIINDAHYRRTTRRLAAKASRIIAINNRIASTIRSVCRIPQHQIAVISNGVNTDYFVPAEKPDYGSTKVIWVGRLHPDKDIQLGLKVFASVVKNCSADVQLIVVGDGEEINIAIECVKELKLDNRVRFVGKVDNVLPYLQASDIFFMSSKTEGSPLALIEAMSCALPVVATAVGGIPEIIVNNSGFVRDHGDEEGLSGCLTQLVVDRQLRHDVGRLARQHVVRNFSEKAMGASYVEILKRTSSSHA